MPAKAALVTAVGVFVALGLYDLAGEYIPVATQYVLGFVSGFFGG